MEKGWAKETKWKFLKDFRGAVEADNLSCCTGVDYRFIVIMFWFDGLATGQTLPVAPYFPHSLLELEDRGTTEIQYR